MKCSFTVFFIIKMRDKAIKVLKNNTFMAF